MMAVCVYGRGKRWCFLLVSKCEVGCMQLHRCTGRCAPTACIAQRKNTLLCTWLLLLDEMLLQSYTPTLACQVQRVQCKLLPIVYPHVAAAILQTTVAAGQTCCQTSHAAAPKNNPTPSKRMACASSNHCTDNVDKQPIWGVLQGCRLS